MKLERVRAVRKRSRWFDGLLTHNPVLVGGMAIPFAVVITTSLKNSVSISILLACSLVPTVLLASLAGARLPRWGAPILYKLFYLARIVACVPLILPIADAFGWDRIWLGIVMIIVVEMGLLTPPFGMVVFSMKATVDDDSVSVESIFRGAMPFLFMMVIAVLLVIFFPSLATWLPSLQ